jgi:hypothetical protein
MSARKEWADYPAPIRDAETGCLRWGGPHNAQGYGTFGRHDMAHREAFRRNGGVIPDGWTIDHVWELGCRYRDCVEPAHLEAVTFAENSRRQLGAIARRTATHCRHGHAYADNNVMPLDGGARKACRTCNRLRQAAFKAKRRQAAD